MARLLFVVLALYCLIWGTSAIALLLGVALALTLGNPFADRTKQATSRLLSASVVGLGAGMNLVTVAQVGVAGIGYTIMTIALAFTVGLLAGRLLRVNENTSLLITIGTAICGGSAIAAAAPVLRAKAHEISVALGIVFMLNALALFLFPALGHLFAMTEGQFGLWSALAIHDTSSVVGSSLQYGSHALEVGTTVKLARALWIVPVTFALGLWVTRRGTEAQTVKPKRPWFIAGFLLMAAVMTWLPTLRPAGHVIETCAKHTLVLTLFLIGTNLTRATLRAVGIKPFVQGAFLWLFMGSVTLLAIVQNWIHAS